MIDKKVEEEISSLDELISRVITQSRTLKSLVRGRPEELEDLQQIAIALHYSMQTLRHKLGFSKVPSTSAANTGLSSDLRMNTRIDNLPIETDGNRVRNK